MNVAPATRRAHCAACLRPQPACICRWVAPVPTRLELLILQHPLEVGNAKNSGRLLHLCLPGSVLATGEAFDDSTLSGLLYAGERQPVLLYPDTPAEAAPSIAQAPMAGPQALQAPDGLRLVVLDATWRKSRKMLYLNPLLQGLPRLALDDVPASNYRIRKAHAPHQLSSLEAAAYAIAQLEGEDGACASLLRSFDGFVAQQAAFVPRLN